MKRLLLLFTCISGISLFVFAAPWTSSEGDYLATRQNPGPGHSVGGINSILSTLLQGKPLKISVDVDGQIPTNVQFYADLTAKVYNNWFSTAVRFIESQGRTREFQDIMHYLQRPVTLTLVPEESATLKISFGSGRDISKWCSGGEANACIRAGHMYLNKKMDKPDNSVFLHEVGHTLGLDDQYAQAQSAGHDQFRSIRRREDSIMGYSNKLTCDDVDGLINLIDVELGEKHGRTEGWVSFCEKPDAKNPETYANGMSLKRGAYGIYPYKRYTSFVLSYFNGKKLDKQLSLAKDSYFFEDEIKTVLDKDSRNRPTKAKGSQGETIYLTYRDLSFPNQVLFVKNGQVIKYELYEPQEYSKKLRNATIVFPQKGNYVLITLFLETNQLFYQTFTQEQQLICSSTFTQKKNLFKEEPASSLNKSCSDFLFPPAKKAQGGDALSMNVQKEEWTAQLGRLFQRVKDKKTTQSL